MENSLTLLRVYYVHTFLCVTGIRSLPHWSFHSPEERQTINQQLKIYIRWKVKSVLTERHRRAGSGC